MRDRERVESQPAAVYHPHSPPAQTAYSWKLEMEHTQQQLLHSELTHVIDYQIHKLELINNLTTELFCGGRGNLDLFITSYK